MDSASASAPAATEQMPLLVRRLGTAPPPDGLDNALRLPLTADQRTRLRGRRLSACGRALLLQLPRGAPLEPGERLATASKDTEVQVEAAAEPLLRVRARQPLGLLQAAYHLGNRHVALQVLEGELRLLADPVLEDLLRQRGLQLDHLEAPFLPEPGAYAAGAQHQHG